jgi:hypothetical protein
MPSRLHLPDRRGLFGNGSEKTGDSEGETMTTVNLRLFVFNADSLSDLEDALHRFYPNHYEEGVQIWQEMEEARLLEVNG